MNFSLLFILSLVVLFLCFPLISLLLFFVVYECFITPLSFILFLFLPSSHRIRTAFISSLFTTFGSISFILPLLILILSDRRISPLLILIPPCIKIPPFPSSYRSPEVHCEANPPIPLLLAGLLSKLGIFGILRSIFPPSPSPLRSLSSFVPSLPLIGLILAPRSSYRYLDSKKMIAFSSILHSNLSFASLLCMNGIGVLCGILTSIAHSFSSSALSLFAGPLINKTYSRY